MVGTVASFCEKRIRVLVVHFSALSELRMWPALGRPSLIRLSTYSDLRKQWCAILGLNQSVLTGSLTQHTC